MAQRGRGAAAGSRPSARNRTARDEARGGARPPAPPRLSREELTAIRTRLRGIVAPVVADAGLDLEDLTVVPAGRRQLVRVTVDGDDGVSHDELSEVARDISAALDAAEDSGGEITPDSYTLEVSSPGVDRPLTAVRHWRRNVGRLVKVRAGDRSITGRVTAVEGNDVVFDVDGREERVALDGLGPGHVQVEFTRLAELTDDEIGDEVTGEDEDESDHGAIGEGDGT